MTAGHLNDVTAPALPAEFWDGPAVRLAMVDQHFGRLLRAYRKACRPEVKQADLARWLGLTQGQVSRMENATSPPSDLDKLNRWAGTLNIPQRVLWFTRSGLGDEARTRPGRHDVEPDGMVALFNRLESTVRDGPSERRSINHVLRTAAESYQYTGWSAYSVGRAAVGHRQLDLALRIAKDLADHALIAQSLAALNHQALFYGSPQAAIGLSRMTARAAARAGMAVLRAEARAMEAYGLALQGDVTQCLAVLHRAIRTGDELGMPAGSHCAFLVGESLHAVGRPVEAERFVRRALTVNVGAEHGGDLDLGNLFGHGLLSSVLVDQRRIEEACVAGMRATRTLRRPVRADAYLAELAREFSPYRGEPEVKMLYARFADIGVPTPLGSVS